MHNPQLRVLLILLALFVGWGIFLSTLQTFPHWTTFGFAVNNVSNASSNAQANVCIGRPPNIEDIPNQLAVVSQLFQYTVNATQYDGHTLNFIDDSSFFIIGLTSGLISFTPAEGDIGSYTITIEASDAQGCRGKNATDTFTLTIGNVTLPVTPNATLTHPRPTPRPGPPAVTPPPPPSREYVQAPYYIIDIRQIIANGEVVYDQYRDIRASEYVVAPNSMVTFQVTVRNIGFNALTNIHLELPLPEGVTLISMNPENVAQLDPNEEYTFTFQVQTNDQPFTLAIKAQADQDSDQELLPITVPPTFEAPQFGFEVPPWLPLFIAIPLLFFLGYSVLSNKNLVRQFLQDLLTGLFAFFLRRTYFIDEDMLRKLIKAKRMNKFLHLHVVPDVHARYHEQYKNLRSKEFKKEEYDKIATVIRKYVIAGEMATLIIMTEEKPHPRIMTTFIPEKQLAEDYKRIKFYDPLRKKIDSVPKAQGLSNPPVSPIS